MAWGGGLERVGLDGMGLPVDGRDAPAERLELGGRQPAQQGAEQLGIELADAFEHGGASVGHGDLLLSAVAGVLVSLQVAVVDEAVDQAAHRGQADLELLGKGGHADTRAKRGHVQALGLRHGDVHAEELGGMPAGEAAHQRAEVLEDGLRRDGAP